MEFNFVFHVMIIMIKRYRYISQHTPPHTHKEQSAKNMSNFTEVIINKNKAQCFVRLKLNVKGHAPGTCTTSHDTEGCFRYMTHLYIELTYIYRVTFIGYFR